MNLKAKLILEMAMYALFFVGGTIWISDAFNGGPSYKWLGVLSWYAGSRGWIKGWNKL